MAETITAKPVTDAVVVSRVEKFDGATYLVVSMDDSSFSTYRKLPKVLEFDGRLFGQSGWNSDRFEVYYTDRTPVARIPGRRARR